MIEYPLIAMLETGHAQAWALSDQYVAMPGSLDRVGTTVCSSGLQLMTPAERAFRRVDPYIGVSGYYLFGTTDADGGYAPAGRQCCAGRGHARLVGR